MVRESLDDSDDSRMPNIPLNHYKAAIEPLLQLEIQRIRNDHSENEDNRPQIKKRQQSRVNNNSTL